MSAGIPTRPAQDAATRHPRRLFLCVALCVAGLANALVPAAFFSATYLYGEVNPGFRALVLVVVAAEYAIALLLLLLHANVGFASGYAVATAATVTLGSAMLAFSTVDSGGWGWSALYAGISIVGGFAFAVLSNTVFLFGSIRYAHAIRARLHIGGFFLGLAASLALLFLYAHILRSSLSIFGDALNPEPLTSGILFQ